ncbi:hypothetical protein GCM10014719_19420 [Planomonospora parontospora subsp. antibiotica]|nr:hypothetical protein GCM10014719_19420 [Planomonospora parontospora subsp. antibiotica]GII15247.1 hypothetical protein Ppa05_19730 [Planomonospora parontospora subsp. antibiotica]
MADVAVEPLDAREAVPAEPGLRTVEVGVEALGGLLPGNRVGTVAHAQVLVSVDRPQVLGDRFGEVLVVQPGVAAPGQALAEHVRDFPGDVGEDVVLLQLVAEDVDKEGSIHIDHDSRL